MQRRSQSGAPENIDLKDTWFNPYLEEDPRNTPTRVLIVAPEGPARKGVSISEVIKRSFSEGLQNTSNLPNFIFGQQSTNVTSGMPYREREKGSKTPKMIYLASTVLRSSARLDNNPHTKICFIC